MKTTTTARRRIRRLVIVAFSIGVIAVVRQAMFARNRRVHGP